MRYPVLVLWWLLAVAGAGNLNAQVTANSKAAGLQQCVEPTEFMRKNHMEILFHQRDKTVRKGIRTKQHSLVQCVACHAERDSEGNFVAINAKNQFCQSCHAATAVDIDCFQCHATKPGVADLSGTHFFRGPATAMDVAIAGPNCTGAYPDYRP